MKTYALCFSVYTYNRAELSKMSDEEKYELASTASNAGYDDASVLTLDELSERINDDAIDFVDLWVYFVTKPE